jgi:hypothetical protein
MPGEPPFYVVSVYEGGDEREARVVAGPFASFEWAEHAIDMTKAREDESLLVMSWGDGTIWKAGRP